MEKESIGALPVSVFHIRTVCASKFDTVSPIAQRIRIPANLSLNVEPG